MRLRELLPKGKIRQSRLGSLHLRDSRALIRPPLQKAGATSEKGKKVGNRFPAGNREHQNRRQILRRTLLPHPPDRPSSARIPAIFLRRNRQGRAIRFNPCRRVRQVPPKVPPPKEKKGRHPLPPDRPSKGVGILRRNSPRGRSPERTPPSAPTRHRRPPAGAIRRNVLMLPALEVKPRQVPAGTICFSVLLPLFLAAKLRQRLAGMKHPSVVRLQGVEIPHRLPAKILRSSLWLPAPGRSHPPPAGTAAHPKRYRLPWKLRKAPAGTRRRQLSPTAARPVHAGTAHPRRQLHPLHLLHLQALAGMAFRPSPCQPKTHRSPPLAGTPTPKGRRSKILSVPAVHL